MYYAVSCRRGRDERDELRAVAGGRRHVARAVLPAPAQERPHPGGRRQRRLELGGRGNRRVLLLARLHRQHRDGQRRSKKDTADLLPLLCVQGSPAGFTPEMKLFGSNAMPFTV